MTNFDRHITLLLNGAHSAYFDSFFYIYTQTITWLPTLVALLYIMWRQGWRQSLTGMAMIAIAILLADQLSSSVIKPLVERLRPSHDPATSPLIHIVRGYRGGLYGFVSSHAANSFAVATIVSLMMKNRTTTLCFLTWAAATAYSRIYLGVHFVGDTVCGAIIGIAVAYITYYSIDRLMSISTKKNMSVDLSQTPYKRISFSCKQTNILNITLLANIAIVAIFALIFIDSITK